MEPHKPHGVPDRVPAAIALQPSQNTAAAAAAGRSSETDHQSAGVGEAADVARELKQPQVVQQQKQQEGRSSPTPVFVPIVVAMDAQDHKVMVEEWYSRHMVSVYFWFFKIKRKKMQDNDQQPNWQTLHVLTLQLLMLRPLTLHLLSLCRLALHLVS